MDFHEPVWATAEGVDAAFEALAVQIRLVEGIDRVTAIFRYETRGLTPQGWGSELVVIVSAAAGAIGIKALDVVAELVKDYIRKNASRRPSRTVTIYDKTGKVIKKVEVD